MGMDEKKQLLDYGFTNLPDVKDETYVGWVTGLDEAAESLIKRSILKKTDTKTASNKKQ